MIRYEIKPVFPKINETWLSNEFREFLITGLKLVDGDPWVEYKNASTGQMYSCRQEAFLARFSLKP